MITGCYINITKNTSRLGRYFASYLHSNICLVSYVRIPHPQAHLGALGKDEFSSLRSVISVGHIHVLPIHWLNR